VLKTFFKVTWNGQREDHQLDDFFAISSDMVETNITDMVDIKINETVFNNARLRILLPN
jgi:hypothetical protein